MTGPEREDLPQAVRDQLDAARGAVPPVDLLDSVTAEVRGARQVRAWPAWLRGSLMGLGAAAVLLLVAFLASGPFAADRTPSATDAPAAVPSGGQLVTVEQDGFRLELWTDRKRYTTDEPISIAATLTYLGPEDSVTLYHPDPILTFLLNEQSGTRSMGGGVDDVCRQTVVRRDEPISIPYTKSAAWTPDDPNAAFYQEWMNDPQLYLPSGTWTVVADGQFSISACGGRDVSIGQKVDISVTLPPGATQGPSPTATPAQATPTPPELSGRRISTAVAHQIVGWSRDGRWLAVIVVPKHDQPNQIVRIFDANGAAVYSTSGADAAWVSSDVLAVLHVDSPSTLTGTLVLHHVSTGVDEPIEGRYRMGLVGSGTGKLAMTVVDPNAPDAIEFKLLGDDMTYPGAPLSPASVSDRTWDPTGRWLAVLDIAGAWTGIGPYPLALLDTDTGDFVVTRYKATLASRGFFSPDGQHVLIDTGGASTAPSSALIDLSQPQAVARVIEGYGPGPALPDGRWLLDSGESAMVAWEPSTGTTLRVGRGYVGVSRTGIAAVIRNENLAGRFDLELHGATAHVTMLGITGEGYHSPVWSPSGDRVAYVTGEANGPGGTDLYLLIP